MSDKRKDLPPVSSSAFLDRVREALQTYLGRQGDILDRGVTLRDLADAGIAKIRRGFLVAGSGNAIEGPGGAVEPAYEPDLTVPPVPTGFAATSGTTRILFEVDTPSYSVGHGHDRTVVYAANWDGVSPLPTFADAVEYFSFLGEVDAAPFDPASNLRLWAKWKTRDGVLSDPAGGTNGIAVATGLIDEVKIADAAIGTAKIGNLAVTTAKIADLNVTEAKIADLAVTTAKINNAAITTAKIGDAQITTAKIGDLAVTTGKIDDLAVTTGKIENLNVTEAKIADLAVTTAKIGDAAITTAKIGDAQITDAKISSLNASKIVAGTITTDKLTANAVTASQASVNFQLTRTPAAGDFADTYNMPSTAVSLTTTGAPVKVLGAIKVVLRHENATVPHSCIISVRLRIDGVDVGMPSEEAITFHVEPGGLVNYAYGTIPLLYRATLAAGSHNFHYRVSVGPIRTSSGTNVAFGANAELITHNTLIVEENKV